MNTHLDELINQWREGRVSDEDLRRLTEALDTPEGRASLRADWFLEAALPEALRTSPLLKVSHKADPQQTRRWTAWLSWRPLTAAAAGIVLGMVCTSVVFGYVAPRVGKVMTLLQEGFESGPAPLVTGMPLEAGKWSGDFAEVVGEQQGVKPETGRKMLRILRADYEGKPKPEGSYAGDLFRLIDLRPFRHEFADGGAVVQASVGFNAASFPERERYSSLVTSYAVSTEMVMSGAFLKEDSLRVGALATASKNMPQLDRDPRSWQRVESELRLPAEADFLLIHVSVLNLTNDEVNDAFRGHYLDDVRVSLIHRSPLP